MPDHEPAADETAALRARISALSAVLAPFAVGMRR